MIFSRPLFFLQRDAEAFGSTHKVSVHFSAPLSPEGLHLENSTI